MRNNDFECICDYKQCCKEGTVYVGDVVDNVETWLSKREQKPTLSIYMCPKHAKKFYKMLGLPFKNAKY